MTQPTPHIDQMLFRAVMGRFATGVTVVTYRTQDGPAGMTANAFMSVSLDPPLILVSVRENSRFQGCVREGDLFGVNMLTEAQQQWSAHFGGRPIGGCGSPFFEHGGVSLIKDSLAHVVARVSQTMRAGDHTIYLASVEDLWLGEDKAPLIFFSGTYKQVRTQQPQWDWGAMDGW